MPDSPPPETLAWLRQSAAVDGATYSQVLLHLLERIEKLEVCDREDANCWASVRQSMHRLRERIEALEQQSTCRQPLRVPPTPEVAPVATDKELEKLADGHMAMDGATGSMCLEHLDFGRACYNLGRKQSAAHLLSLEKELERERFRLAACGVVAMADTPESAAKARDICPDFWSASLDDVIRQVDALMEARAAQPTPPLAPAGGLMERVTEAIVEAMVIDDRAAASAAIREVAAWLRVHDTGYNAARLLEREADR